jgi:hypothetical protein
MVATAGDRPDGHGDMTCAVHPLAARDLRCARARHRRRRPVAGGLLALRRRAPRGAHVRRAAEFPRTVVRCDRHPARRHAAGRLSLDRRRQDLAHDDTARLEGALGRLHAGIDDRLPRSAPGAWQPRLRPHRRTQALALPRRQRARALVASQRQALRSRPGTYWRLYVTPTPRVPGTRGPRSTARLGALDRSRACEGGADVVYAAAGAGRRSVDAGVSWSRLPVAANAQSVATTPALAARVVALPELSWSDDYGRPTRAARARRSSPRSAQRPHLVRGCSDGSCSSPPTAAAAGRRASAGPAWQRASRHAAREPPAVEHGGCGCHTSRVCAHAVDQAEGRPRALGRRS